MEFKHLVLLTFLRIALTFREDCLKKREKRITTYNIEEIRARGVVVRENDSIRFKCDICSRTRGLKWIQTKNLGSTTMIVGIDEHKYVLEAALRRDSGRYACVVKDKVIDSRPAIVESTRHNVAFYEKWTHWSPCDKCDEIGRRTRYGICYVKKLNPSKPSEFKVLDYFDDNGIPCFASFSSRGIKKEAAGLNRSTRVDVQLCRVKCQEKVRKKKYVEFSGNSLIINCPGIENGTAVVWKKTTARLADDHLSDRGRINVDFVLHFTPLRLTDSGIYSCHVNGRRVATILLKVLRRKTVDHAVKSIIVIVALVWLCFLIRNN